MNRALVIFKPDAVQRGMCHAMRAILENNGFTIERYDVRILTRPELAEHYVDHAGKPFFTELVEFMNSGFSAVMIAVADGPPVVQEDDPIEILRCIIGETNPHDANLLTIRGMLRRPGSRIMENLIHASDSPEAAEREIRIFYPD